MEIIEFDPGSDATAGARFELWRTWRPTLVALCEETPTRYVAHVASCSLIDAAAQKVGSDNGCEPPVKRCEKRGAEIAECPMCVPRLPLRRALFAVRRESVWLWSCVGTCRLLFDGQLSRDVLARTAPLFAQELSVVLQEYCTLLASRLTDPPRTRGKQGRESLTVCNLNEHLQKAGLMNQAIEDAGAGLMRFRMFVVMPRNRLIAHIDKEAAIRDEPIGGFAPHELDDFLQHLQTYNDEVGKAVGEGPSDFPVSQHGDASTLLEFLRVGLQVKHRDIDKWFDLARSDLPD
jgi:hypothetical protein